MVNSLSKYKVKKIITCFCEDIDATKTSNLLGINRNTINKYFNQFRLVISTNLFSRNNKMSGELDESYFGAKRVRGKRGRGAAGKTPVFGLPKRDGKVKEMAKYMLRYLKTVPVPA